MDSLLHLLGLRTREVTGLQDQQNQQINQQMEAALMQAHVEVEVEASLQPETAVAVAEPKVEAPRPGPIEEPTEIGDEYRSIAKKLGIVNPAVERADFVKALQDEGVPVYDNKAVREYMRAQCQKEDEAQIAALMKQHDWPREYATRYATRTEWRWVPVREKDAPKYHEYHAVPGAELMLGQGAIGSTGYLGFSGPTMWSGPHQQSAATYDKPIPLPVLLTMDKIQERVPNAQFRISDYYSVKPDPFLAVSTPNLWSRGEYFVVERWDEPQFR